MAPKIPTKRAATTARPIRWRVACRDWSTRRSVIFCEYPTRTVPKRRPSR